MFEIGCKNIILRFSSSERSIHPFNVYLNPPSRVVSTASSIQIFFCIQGSWFEILKIYFQIAFFCRIFLLLQKQNVFFQNVSMSPIIIITVLRIHKQIFHNQIMGVFLPNFAHILQCYITFRQVRLKYIKFNFYRHKINIAHRVFRTFYFIYLPSDFSSFKKRNLIEKWKKNISPRGNKIWKDRTKNCILIYRFVSDTFTIIKQTEMKYLPCTITYSLRRTRLWF